MARNFKKKNHVKRDYNAPVEAEVKVLKNITIAIPEVITVKDFAEKADIPVVSVISELMKNGMLATINETIDFDTASIIGEYLGVTVEKEAANSSKNRKIEEITSECQNLLERPPIVTIMGHVDHGKTSLLDAIRKTHVTSSESGGITQHISAYQVQLKNAKRKEIENKLITFIDTPGHAAFSAMREHGTVITDIVVLIVAANDGVMPQTKEVIEQAQQNNVPIIVAINKVDLPDADIIKTKQQLSEYNLVAEDWGGKTVMAEVSAKTGQGIDDLLELILLQAEMMELKANYDCKAVGVVVESHMAKGAGSVAVVLVENGILRQGDPIAIGSSFGKVRVLKDYTGKTITEATPSTPVLVSGLKTLPEFGNKLVVYESEKSARESAQQFQNINSNLHVATAKRINDESTDNENLKVVDFNVIVKTDVKGSLEALRKSLTDITHPEVRLNIISDGIGAVSESDVILARATHAKIYGFRVMVSGAAKKIAELEKIEAKTFTVIYELIDTVRAEMSNLLPPLIIEDELGRGVVLAIFRDDKKGFVAGGRVESGRIAAKDMIKVLQDDNEKYRSKIESLRREKSDVKECASGTECGFSLPAHAKVSVGDTFVLFSVRSEKRFV